jgi:hypothetical protein
MRTKLPEGSRNAQSRTPHGCDAGSWSTSAPLARTFSKVARSSDRKIAACSDPRGHEREERVAFGLRTTAMRLGENNVDVLSRCADGDPAKALRGDIGPDLKA